MLLFTPALILAATGLTAAMPSPRAEHLAHHHTFPKRGTLPQPAAKGFHDRRSARRVNRRQSGTLTSTEPSSLASGSATSDEGCTNWYSPVDGDSCYSVIALSPNLTLSDFIGLNPSVGQACQELDTGLYYCIDTDHLTDSEASSISSSAALATNTGKCAPKSSGSSGNATVALPTAPLSVGVAPTAPIVKSSTSPAPKATSTSTTSSSPAGTIQLSGSQPCAIEASETSSMTSGPNGAISFLDCGISQSDPNSAWKTPTVSIDQVVYKNLSYDGLFSACSDYAQFFESAAQANGIPAIFLASFAMEESSCDANASGDEGGAFGLMQITSDKCGGAPNGNCNDPEYNINTGAAYFKSVLDDNNGSLLLALGAYNGWPAGMTYAQATAQADTCCECQNNLDYLHQFLNGWAQNVDPTNMTPFNNVQCNSDTGLANRRRMRRDALRAYRAL